MRSEFTSHQAKPQHAKAHSSPDAPAKATQAKPNGKPLGSTKASTDPTKQQVVKAKLRYVQYKIVCAPKNPPYVTDAPSNLNRTPFALANAADGKVFYPKEGSKPSFAKLSGSSISQTAAVLVPDAVQEVVIFLGNDAYKSRRKTKLFKVKPADTGTTVVTIYETYSKDTRINNLKTGAKTAKLYPQAEQSQTTQSADDKSFVGYLTGDVWTDFSYEYSIADIKRLCKPSELERIFTADSGRGVAPEASLLSPSSDLRSVAFAMGLPKMAIDNTYVAPKTRPFTSLQPEVASSSPTPADLAVPSALKAGDKEKLSIADWSRLLAPIYTGLPTGLTNPRAEGGGEFHLPIVNIRLKYNDSSFKNAILTSERTTVQQILKRTSPLAYQAVIEAAWKSGIDELEISSTWRPMLGSNQHRMGVALDVLYVDDLDDKKPSFSVHINSGAKPSELYKTFQADLSSNTDNIKLLKDPWKNTDANHKNHLHLKTSDPDEE
jgi:hypothetical protein